MTQAPPLQTLASGGATIDQKYGKYGRVPKAEASDPDTMSTMWVGEPGVGKTSLDLSNPNALILHFDPTSLPHNPENPKAMVFPLFDPRTGRFVDAKGTRMEWSWGTYVDFVDTVVKDVAVGRKVPKRVCHDSMSSMFTLASIPILEDMGAEHLGETDARKSYPRIYHAILKQHWRLRAAGRGVGYSTHIMNKFVDLGEDEGKMMYTISSFPDSFYGKMFGICDFVLAVTATTTKIAKPKPGAVKLPSGQYSPRDVLMVSKTAHNLVHRDPRLNGITKCHEPLPDPWPIPRENAWGAFREAYMNAASKPKEQE